MPNKSTASNCPEILRKGGAQVTCVFVLALLLCCGSCASTKSVEPILMVQQGDQGLTCSQLDSEIYANQVAAVNFSNQARETTNSNEKLHVSEFLNAAMPWQELFVDLSKEDQIKMKSLQDRNQYLTFLKEQKKC